MKKAFQDFRIVLIFSILILLLQLREKEMRDHFGKINFRFAYPEIESSLNVKNINKYVLLKTLKAVLGTLDPTLTNVSISSDLQDSFIIRRKNDEIIIQNGKLLNRELLSVVL